MLSTAPNEFNWNATNVGSTFTDTGTHGRYGVPCELNGDC